MSKLALREGVGFKNGVNPIKKIISAVNPGADPLLDDLRVYLITQRSLFTEQGFLETLELALEGGVRALQLREKDLSPEEIFFLAQKVRSLTGKYGAKLFINDRVDIAHMVKADGVQLTENSVSAAEVRQNFPDLLVGVSTHSMESACQAESAGAHFITFSPIFETPSKMEFGPPQGLEQLRAVCREVKLPVLALGGISKNRVLTVLEQGAFGVALISGIWNGPDIKQESFEYMQFFGRREPT